MRVEHFGYLGAVRDTKDKSRRNIELLERQVAEGVDNPFLHFNLGSEYAAVGDAPRALTHFERAWTDRPRRPGASAATATRRRWPRARPRAAQRRPPGRRRDGRRRGARDLPGLHRHRPRAGARRRRGRRRRAPGGAAAPLPGDGRRARAATRRPSAAAPTARSWRSPTSCAAAARVDGGRGHCCAAACASTPASWPPSTPTRPRCCAAASPRPRSSRPSTPSWPTRRPSVRFLLAVALSEAGAVAEAESRAARGASQAQPANAHARVALAETLLAQGRFADAAADGRGGRPRGAVRRRRAAHRALRPADRRDARPTPRAARRPARRGARRLRRLGGRALRRRRPGRAPGRGRRAPCSSCSTPWRACRPSTPSPTSWPCSRPSPCPGASAARRWPSCTCATATPTRPPRSGSRRASRAGVDGAGAARAGRGGRRPRARRGRPGVRRRGRSAGRGLIALKFSWRLPNPLTTSRAMDGPDQHFQEELRTP